MPKKMPNDTEVSGQKISNPFLQVAGKVSGKVAGKEAGKVAGKEADKVAGKVAGKVADKEAGKVAACVGVSLPPVLEGGGRSPPQTSLRSAVCALRST